MTVFMEDRATAIYGMAIADIKIAQLNVLLELQLGNFISDQYSYYRQIMRDIQMYHCDVSWHTHTY